MEHFISIKKPIVVCIGQTRIRAVDESFLMIRQAVRIGIRAWTGRLRGRRHGSGWLRRTRDWSRRSRDRWNNWRWLGAQEIKGRACRNHKKDDHDGNPPAPSALPRHDRAWFFDGHGRWHRRRQWSWSNRARWLCGSRHRPFAMTIRLGHRENRRLGGWSLWKVSGFFDGGDDVGHREARSRTPQRSSTSTLRTTRDLEQLPCPIGIVSALYFDAILIGVAVRVGIIGIR